MDRELLARRLSQRPEPDTPVDSAQQPVPGRSTGDGAPPPGPTSRENVPWDRPGPEAWPASDLQQLTLDDAPLPQRQEGDQADDPTAEAPPWDRPAEELEPAESTLTTGPAWDRPDDYSWPSDDTWYSVDAWSSDDNWSSNDSWPTADTTAAAAAADVTAAATYDEMPEFESVLARISESEELASDPDDALAPVVADLGTPIQADWPSWPDWTAHSQVEPDEQDEPAPQVPSDAAPSPAPVADARRASVPPGDPFDFAPASRLDEPLEPQVSSPPSEAEPARSRPTATNIPVNLVIRIELAVEGKRLVPVEVTLRSASKETVESPGTRHALVADTQTTTDEPAPQGLEQRADVEPAYVLEAPPYLEVPLDQQPPFDLDEPVDLEAPLDLEPAGDLDPIYLLEAPPNLEAPLGVEPPPDLEPTGDSAPTGAVEQLAGFAPVTDPLADLPAPPPVAEPPAATGSTGSPDQAPDAFVALPAELPDPWRASQPYAPPHASAAEDAAEAADKPSSLMTAGVTIGFAILVVALLFVFVQLVTSWLA